VVVLPLYRCYSRRDTATLIDVGDKDWLEEGHGGGEGLQSMIKGTSSPAGDRVSIRNVLRGSEHAPPRPTRRRTKAMVGWLLYCCTAVGGTAAAFTVRETLFPSLGSPTKPALWITSKIDSTLSTEHGSTSTAHADTTVVVSTTIATTVSAPSSSVEAQTVPSASAQIQGPGPENTTDTRGPGGGAPQTGTTVDDNPSSGPGPGTTADTHPTDSSTPGSATSPPTSDDTTASEPETEDSSGGGNSGKGGGGDDDTSTSNP
jgi:hypothetical protein